MASRSLPKYFVSRADAPAPPAPSAELLTPARVADCFRVGARHIAPREYVVTTSAAGGLLALPNDDRHEFSEAIQAELNYHELSGAARKRHLEAAEFFLFHLQLLEQSIAAPGWNDPVYLYGTLSGPYPDGAPAASAVEGQLTVTRADLLEGLVRGAEYAFRYAGETADGAPPRCFHLALPAGDEEEIKRGHGIVLAYPLLPPELAWNETANELIVGQLLFDTLSALKEDLAREGVRHPLTAMTLPVPSRFTLEQQLISQGYEIDGDRACRRAAARNGLQGLLASVFGSLVGETLDLPPEAGVDDFLATAKRTLDALPGWPTPRAAALRARITPAPPGVEHNRPRGPITPPQIKIPTAGASPAVRPPVTHATPATANSARAAEPAEWMRDFIQAHRQAGAPEPRLTGVTPPPPVRARNNRPEWMNDFAPQSPAPHTNEPQRPAPTVKPEWMRDFE